MSILWGADRLIPYFDYDQKKVTWPPQWFIGQPFWRYFRHYAAYVNRAQFMNGQGEHIAPVAIYYPLETAFANSSPALHTGAAPRSVLEQLYRSDGKFLYRAAARNRAPGLGLSHPRFRVSEGSRRSPRQTPACGRELSGAYFAADDRHGARVPPEDPRIRRSGGVVLALGSQPAGLDGAGIQRFPAATHKPFTDHLDYLEQIQVP